MAYNEEAVEREIRKDRRIKGKEARLIHALLRGRETPAERGRKAIEQMSQREFDQYVAGGAK